MAVSFVTARLVVFAVTRTRQVSDHACRVSYVALFHDVGVSSCRSAPDTSPIILRRSTTGHEGRLPTDGWRHASTPTRRPRPGSPDRRLVVCGRPPRLDQPIAALPPDTGDVRSQSSCTSAPAASRQKSRTPVAAAWRLSVGRARSPTVSDENRPSFPDPRCHGVPPASEITSTARVSRVHGNASVPSPRERTVTSGGVRAGLRHRQRSWRLARRRD